MSFPLSILLYLYYAFLFFWAVFSLAMIYHMLKFGFKTATTFFVTFIYLAVAIIIITGSFSYINQVDWQSELTLFPGVLSAPNKFMQ